MKLGLALALVLAAQAPRSFEAASVKPNNSGASYREIGPNPTGRFSATNIPARDLIAYAYGISQDATAIRIVGAPKWIDDDRFDVIASVDGAWTLDQMREMVRTLLVDRFKLAAHSETRELPTYALIVSPDRPLGLKRSQVDEALCNARRAAIQRREPVPPLVPGARPICGSGRTNPGRITSTGFPVDQLAAALGQFVSRVVTDKTGLSGLWDYELKWTPDVVPPVLAGAPRVDIDPNGPSIFTALQEQLGLKLDSTRGPVDVVVIDHVERPTED